MILIKERDIRYASTPVSVIARDSAIGESKVAIAVRREIKYSAAVAIRVGRILRYRTVFDGGATSDRQACAETGVVAGNGSVSDDEWAEAK